MCRPRNLFLMLAIADTYFVISRFPVRIRAGAPYIQRLMAKLVFFQLQASKQIINKSISLSDGRSEKASLPRFRRADSDTLA